MRDAFVSYTEADGKEERTSASTGSDAKQETFSAREEGDSPESRCGTLGRQGFIYFIEAEEGRLIKIGYSTQPMMRVGQLGTLMPIKVLGYFPGSKATERWLHTKFAEDHEIGEWFRSTTALRDLISMLGLIQPAPQRIRKMKPAPQPEPENEEDSTIQEEPGALFRMAKDPAAVALGRKGGKVKVPKGAAMLSPEERQERAKAMLEARWGPKKKAATKKAKKR